VEFYRKIYQQVGTGIAISNWHGIFQECNPAYCALVGYTENELRAIDFASLIHPEDREANLVQVRRLQVGEIPSFTIENRYIHKNGEPVWVHKYVSLLHGEGGEPTHFIALVTNITERKRAEQDLAKANERLRLAIESGGVGGWDYDVETMENVWFGKAHAQLGMAPDETSELRREFWAHVHADDRERLENVLQVARDRHEEFAEDFRVVWRDGTIHWLRSRGRYYYAADGKPERMLGISVDITESKQTEQALRESEQRLRLAMQAGRMYAYDWDVTTNLVMRSPEYVNILGPTEPLRFPHQQFVDRIHPDDRPKFLAAIAGLTPENPTGEVTYRVLASDCGVVWLKSNGRGFFNAEGRLVRVIGMVADVTAQKLAEEALRTSEERLRMAQWAAHIGIFDLNIRTGVDIWTPETEALYGLPPGSFGGTLTAFENLIHPEDRGRIIELTREMLRTGQPAEGEWRAVWPDGSVHWIAGRGQVLMDQSGEPSRMLGVNMDITERKRAEESLSGMTQKLVEAQEQERIRIARELHDDINQRLALLAIELDRVRERRNDLPSEIRDLMQELLQMTTDISSRVYSLSHELHSLTPDALGLAKGMRSWCREFGERQKLKIDFTSADVPTPPQDISLCLFRVLQEALHNAAKHSGEKRIEVQLSGTSGEIHLIVSDSGKGFDIKAERRGLGLTSMQERVRLVGGALAIESKPMGGTTIHVRVPLGLEHRSQRAAV
jgi:PAS domain S-box-containing protein